MKMDVHLEESPELLRAIVGGTTDAVFVKDREGRYRLFNAAAARFTGKRPEDVIGRDDTFLFPPDEAAAVMAGDRAVMAAGQVMTYEDTVTSADGVKRVFLSTKGPVFDEDGQVAGLFGISRDITDQRSAQEQLRLAARVFDRSAEGVVVTDVHGRILTVNAAFTEVTGYAQEEAVGKTSALLQSGRHGADFYAEMWETLQSKGWWQGEIWNRRKNGEIYLEWLSINSVKDADGRVANYVGLFSDITVVKESQQRIEFLATHDELTGLPNRTLLNDRLRSAIARARRAGSHLAVMFADLDDFKVINDTLGHELGDALLRQAAQRLRECVRAEDTVARMGGDEFVVLLEATDRDRAAGTAERIIRSLSAAYVIGGQECFVSASLGICFFPDDAQEHGDLLRHADTAMYRAKEQGKNIYQFFSNEMAERAQHRLSIETGLRRAIEHGELFVEYQPQVDLRSGFVVGAEALVRWRRDGKTVPPLSFIPVAEETHLIVDIGEWVVGEVCGQLQRWDELGLSHFNVSVNISARHFRLADMVPRLQAIVAAAGIDPRRICLEITEGALADANGAMTMLAELQAFGFETSVDDFGTGFSSLSHLKRFPIHELKVDRSFVDGIVGDRDDRAITSAIIAMARSLDLRVVAEGVETEAQLAELLAFGCDIGQGYLYAKPLAGADFAAWMLAKERRPPPIMLAACVTPGSAGSVGAYSRS